MDFIRIAKPALPALALGLLACGTEPSLAGPGASRGPSADAGSGPAPSVDAAVGSVLGGDELPGRELVVRVTAESTTFVDLAAAAVLEGDVADTTAWDLAFRGWDVFTNGGPSGPGDGAAFGPADELDYLFEELPSVPFLRADTTGGAFLDWYDYDGANHSVWSRYHVYGVRDGERLWKLQILSYYGEDAGASVGALYRFRYAEVTAAGVGETHEVVGLDATAGYPEVSDDAGSGCIDLGTGAERSLVPGAALDSEAWHLCFRREAIAINGEQGGPRGVTAVDLDAHLTLQETLEEVKERTPEGERARFDAVGREALEDEGLHYRGDRTVSVFGDRWYEGNGAAARPTRASWLVRGADGKRYYLLVFRDLQGSAEASGQVTLRVREVVE